LQFLHGDANLNKLYIQDIGVPWGPSKYIRDDEACTCGPLFEKGNDSNVIPQADAVEM